MFENVINKTNDNAYQVWYYPTYLQIIIIVYHHCYRFEKKLYEI